MAYQYTGLPIQFTIWLKRGFGIDGKDEFWSTREQKSAAIPWLSIDRKISLRYLLETIGTEWGRNLICQNLWPTIAAKRFDESLNGFIVKDVRFENERIWLKEMGGTLIHVLRPNYFNSDATVGHPSNVPLEIREGEKVIINDDTLDVLMVRTIECLSEIL